MLRRLIPYENNLGRCYNLMSSQAGLINSKTPSGPADVNLLPRSGCTPLMRFIVEDNIEAATLCIEEEANICGVDDQGMTPLIYCARHSTTTEIAALLIRKKVDVNQSDNDGWTPLLHSIAKGITEISKLLIENGAKVNLFNNEGETALMYCAQYSAVDSATRLIEYGADVDQENCYGWTPLTYCACYGGSTKIAEILVHEWADVNHSDHDGWTPLVHCALNGRMQIADVLVRNGAGISRPVKGKTMKHIGKLV